MLLSMECTSTRPMAPGSDCTSFEDVGVGVYQYDGILVRGEDGPPLRGGHLVQVLQGLGFSGGIFVEDEYDVLAVGPLLDFRAKNSRQMRGGDVLDRVVFVDDHGHVVGEAGGDRGAKKCQDADCGTDSHHEYLSLEASSVDRGSADRSFRRSGLIQSDEKSVAKNRKF